MELSKDQVEGEGLSTYQKRRTRRNIDEAVLVDLLTSRKILTESIRKNNPDLDLEVAKESVQKILDRLIVIRVAEDRGIISSDSLWHEQESWTYRGSAMPLMRSLKSIFRDFDYIYNTKLFEVNPCEDLKIDSDILESVINTLYRYNFDLLSADVLGAIYEDYIGHVLQSKGREINIVKSLETRKNEGIYLHPTFNSGIHRQDCSRPDSVRCQGYGGLDIQGSRLLDPAAGNGSFLKAYDVFREWYEDYSASQSTQYMEQSEIYRSSKGVVLLANVGKRILTENLYGVDVDPQAAEIASVNLMLKALERGKKLPVIIGQNIHISNSLVSASPAELRVRGQGGKANTLEGFVWAGLCRGRF